ncbi:MAG: hypothetical protein KDD62_10885, partial [Bdellovibrionales bacterium]|nr:hypothetical protein [Bdellovibrionales bacterium]
DDGYKVMRDSDQTYDAIYIDFPAPADYNLSKLYSREFFHFVRERLTKNGFLAFDATGIGFLSTPSVMDRQVPVPGNDWPIYYNTLKAAGFDTIVPYVTTLETDNPKAWEILNQVQGNMLIDERVATLLLQTEDTQERETILRLGRQAAIQSALVDHTMSLQQGFIAAAKNPSALRSRRFVELGINLRVLTPARFYLAFEVDFPTTANVEWRYVNSILRPTFPTSPWYQPRLAF